MSRAVTVFKTKTAVSPKTDGNRNRYFLVPDERLLSLDNRQDLQLRPNWDRRNNNDERAYLSAPNFYLRTKMK